jgi:transcriptional regulator with XRE-family HTH domain
MDFATYRSFKGLTLEQCADALGLKSKGSVADIESGRRAPSVNLALRIEGWSGGAVSASELNPVVRQVQEASFPESAA